MLHDYRSPGLTLIHQRLQMRTAPTMLMLIKRRHHHHQVVAFVVEHIVYASVVLRQVDRSVG